MVDPSATEDESNEFLRSWPSDSTAFLRNLIEVFPLGTLVIAPDHRVVLANRAAREASGHPDPVAEGVKCHELTHFSSTPCTGADDPCPLKEVIRTKAPVTTVHTHYDVAGHGRKVEVRAAPILDEDGEVQAIIEATIDVQGDRRDEEKLRTSEEQHRVLVELAPTPMVVLAPDLTCTLVNPALVELLGRSSAELLGRPHTDVVTTDDRDDLAQILAMAVCHKGRPFPLPLLRLARADGRAVAVRARVTAIPRSAAGGALTIHYEVLTEG